MQLRIQSVTYQGDGIPEGHRRITLFGPPDIPEVTLLVRNDSVWGVGARAGDNVAFMADLLLCRSCNRAAWEAVREVQEQEGA